VDVPGREPPATAEAEHGAPLHAANPKRLPMNRPHAATKGSSLRTQTGMTMGLQGCLPQQPLTHLPLNHLLCAGTSRRTGRRPRRWPRFSMPQQGDAPQVVLLSVSGQASSMSGDDATRQHSSNRPTTMLWPRSPKLCRALSRHRYSERHQAPPTGRAAQGSLRHPLAKAFALQRRTGQKEMRRPRPDRSS
jgi:hypothetical protein